MLSRRNRVLPCYSAHMPTTSIRLRVLGPDTVLGRALPRAGRTILLLCKLMLPISLGVGLLRWTGALEAIGRVLSPAMAVFHLPGEAAVPLVTGYLAGIYALLGAPLVAGAQVLQAEPQAEQAGFHSTTRKTVAQARQRRVQGQISKSKASGSRSPPATRVSRQKRSDSGSTPESSPMRRPARATRAPP